MKNTRWDAPTTTRLAGSPPSKGTCANPRDEIQFQRAVQVYLWALPAMNVVAMRDAQAAAFGGGNNVLTVWKDQPNAKTTLAPADPAVIYGLAFLDLREGPLIFETPPHTQGLLDDFWHRPLTLIGGAGPDKGKGGSYLLLPPEYKEDVPDGYFVQRSPTNNLFIFLRGLPVERIERSRIYLLQQKRNPPSMEFPNASASSPTCDLKRGLSYFESLAKFLDQEPPAREDKAMIGIAARLGIAKSQPFNPDNRMESILNAAAEVACKMSKTRKEN